MIVQPNGGTRRAFVVALAVLALAPGSAAADPYQPPAWLDDGFELLRARGGSCRPIDLLQQVNSTQTRHSVGEECHSRVPVEVWESVGGNPVLPQEHCSGQGIDVTGPPPPPPTPAQSSFAYYDCLLVAAAGTDSDPNPVAWVCERTESRSSMGSFIPLSWIARANDVFPKARDASLAGCLAARAHRRRPRAARRLLPRLLDHAHRQAAGRRPTARPGQPPAAPRTAGRAAGPLGHARPAGAETARPRPRRWAHADGPDQRPPLRSEDHHPAHDPRTRLEPAQVTRPVRPGLALAHCAPGRGPLRRRRRATRSR